MGYFVTNAQEEALKEIGLQMRIANNFGLLRELHDAGVLSDDAYIEKLKQLHSVT